MTEFTPTTEEIVAAYVESRRSTSQVPERQGLEEFYHWLDAHDQGIRDAAKPPAMTAREHLEAAWDAAYPVPAGCAVPAGVAYIRRWGSNTRFSVTTGTGSFAASQNIRTLDPLPPLIPDDCKEVRASSDEDPLRSVWIRDARAVDAWVTVTVLGEVMRAHTTDLIDPKPVPEEER